MTGWKAGLWILYIKLADSLFLTSRPERHPFARSGRIDAERFALEASTDNRFTLILVARCRLALSG